MIEIIFGVVVFFILAGYIFYRILWSLEIDEGQYHSILDIKKCGIPVVQDFIKNAMANGKITNGQYDKLINLYYRERMRLLKEKLKIDKE